MSSDQRLLSSDPNVAIQEMMTTIDAVRSVYMRETDALMASNTRAFLELQEEKLQTARLYQKGVEEIMARSDEMRSINPLAKKRLMEMQKDFSVLAKKNIEALDRMQKTISRLGETISLAARESAKKQRTFSYGQHGKVDSDKRTVSMGLRETA